MRFKNNQKKGVDKFSPLIYNKGKIKRKNKMEGGVE